MRKMTKICLFIATLLVAVGTGIFIGTMSSCNWDFEKLDTGKYVTNSYKIDENFDEISISVNTADVEFLYTDDDFCTVKVFESVREKHSAKVEDGTLVIETFDTRKWYDHIGINFHTPKVSISLPKSDYASLFLETDTGDVEIPEDFTFEKLHIDGQTSDVDIKASVLGELKIGVSTGDVNITKVSVGELVVTSSTGDVKLKKVLATERLKLKTSTGDVTLVDCDAESIYINTSTGDVTGTLLTDKVFITETSTGDLSLPKTTTGGLCEITTSTGDITIDVIK